MVGGELPDLVQFTGGEDVDPALYNHARHPSTYSNPRRDSQESHIFTSLRGQVKFAGICRGGQFLNVMNGGTMYQHVDRHTMNHIATDLLSGRDLEVTSTHHQMMIPSASGQILMCAKESTMRWLEQSPTRPNRDAGEVDVEAIFYSDTNSLCYQPHPEYLRGDDDCQEVYFEYLKTLLNLG